MIFAALKASAFHQTTKERAEIRCFFVLHIQVYDTYSSPFSYDPDSILISSGSLPQHGCSYELVQPRQERGKPSRYFGRNVVEKNKTKIVLR